MSAALSVVVPSFAGDVAARRPPRSAIVVPGVKPATALEVRPAPEMVTFGIASLDALTGGVPRGALTEMVGEASSGRTSITMKLMAEVTQRQEVCAVIDASDSFDPASAEAAGVELQRVLWVRCGKRRSQESGVGSQRTSAAEAARASSRGAGRLKSSPYEIVPHVEGQVSPAEEQARRVQQSITNGCFEAARGRREAPTLRNIAPPAKNISWSIHENYDARLRHRMLNGDGSRATWTSSRIAARANLIPTATELRAQLKRTPSFAGAAEAKRAKWARLDQALKATDLLIQSGGFGLIVIDLGDVPADQARRIPLTSWFRFRRAVENTPTILLLIARDSCAKTCASLVLNLSAEKQESQKQESGVRSQKSVISLPRTLTHACLLDGLRVQIEVARTRLERKPPRSVGVHVQTQTSWRKTG